MSECVVTDPADVMFWTADNWPGELAPCEVSMRVTGGDLDRLGRPWLWVYVTLWVPERIPLPPQDGHVLIVSHLWAQSGSARWGDAWALAREFQEQLKAERATALREVEVLNALYAGTPTPDRHDGAGATVSTSSKTGGRVVSLSDETGTGRHSPA